MDYIIGAFVGAIVGAIAVAMGANRQYQKGVEDERNRKGDLNG